MMRHVWRRPSPQRHSSPRAATFSKESQVDKVKQAAEHGRTMTRLLSVPEVAARFGVTNQTVRNWIASGRLTAMQPGSRGRYRIAPDSVRTLEEGGRRPSRPLDAELARVVSAIVASVHPDAVILFGSRARGDATPNSDIDLAIVAPDGTQRRRLAMRAYESIAAIQARSVAVDLVVLTPQIIAAERRLAGSVAQAVVQEGILVHGSAR